MICTNLNQATRVARIGADKMTSDDYTLFAPEFDAPENVYYVARNDGEATYRVVLGDNDTYTCNCAFYQNNAQFGACKHGEYVLREKEVGRQADEMTALMEDFEVTEYMRATGHLPR